MKKILVVDDDEGVLDAFKALLESADYIVEISRNADYFRTLISENYPDLILLDALLSGQDGRDICRHLKSQEETKHIPVIMVSAHPNIAESIKKAGADDYISKPFEMDELLSKIKEYI